MHIPRAAMSWGRFQMDKTSKNAVRVGSSPEQKEVLVNLKDERGLKPSDGEWFY